MIYLFYFINIKILERWLNVNLYFINEEKIAAIYMKLKLIEYSRSFNYLQSYYKAGLVVKIKNKSMACT